MVAKLVRHIVMLVFLLLANWSFAQGHLLSEVKLDKKNVFVGEPIRVSVSIYTSTWFTQGVNYGNVKVAGAFTVFFSSEPTSKKIKGKNYAGIIMTYNVFPYSDDDIVFPALEIEIETPNDGDYNGVKRIVKTTEKEIVVKPIPKGYDKKQWLVSTGLTATDNWSGDLTNVKVGDVLERSISRKIKATVAELVPPIRWDSIPGISQYLSRTEIDSKKTKTNISASRTDGMRYLFEKEGEIIIPEITLVWWNPSRNKLYKKTLEEKKILVQANPDLGMIESLRDSLQLSATGLQTEEEESLDDKLGLSIEKLIIGIVVLFLLVKLILKIIKWTFITKGLLARIKKSRHDYLQSEKHIFRKFLLSTLSKDKKKAINALYIWINMLELEEATLSFFVKMYGSESFAVEVSEIEREITKGNYKLDVLNIIKARSNYLKRYSGKSKKKAIYWINP